MKTKIFNLLALILLVNFFNAQDYMRSSLSMILIESDDFPNKNAVLSSWNNYPFPDKYNDFTLDLKKINLNNINLSDEDLKNEGLLQDTLTAFALIKAAAKGSEIRYLNNEKTIGFALPTEKQKIQFKINKTLREKKVAHQIVSKWYGLKNGKFDNKNKMLDSLGSYDISLFKIEESGGQALGSEALLAAGEQLVSNSFVTFTSLEFMSNEPVARAIKDEADKSIREEMADKPPILLQKALEANQKVYEKTKEGYSLWSKTWLYQLDWNVETQQIFYNEYWNDIEAYNNSDLIKLKFVGNQYNQSLVTFKIGEKRTQEQIIDLALVRNVNNAFAKLQKKNDVFKPLVPITGVNPLRAEIGLKDGIVKGDKFDVLSNVGKPGFPVYEVSGSISVDKKTPVWDNRYNAGEEAEPQLDKDGNVINATGFKGSKKIMVGTMIKLAK